QDAFAALFAADGRRNGSGLGRKRFAFLVQIDDGRAAWLALFVFDGVAGAAEELAKAPAAFDHVAPADRALVFGDLANRGLSLLIHRAGGVAFAIAAGEEKAVLADAIEHRAAALLAFIWRRRAAGVLDFFQCAVHDGMERAVEILQQLDPVEML